MTKALEGKVALITGGGSAIEREGCVTTTTPEEWREVMDADLEAMMQIARASLPAMLEGSGGSIVNVSSLAAHVAPGNMAAYVHQQDRDTRAYPIDGGRLWSAGHPRQHPERGIGGSSAVDVGYVSLL